MVDSRVIDAIFSPPKYIVIDTIHDALTETIRMSIEPAPSMDGEDPPASAQLPVVTQMQTPEVLLFTIKLAWAKAALR
jgi:hypothetical protein